MKTMKKITLTRNGQTAPRDVETSTMHADGLVVGQGVMLRIKGDSCYKGPTEYQQYVVTKIVKSDRFDKKCGDASIQDGPRARLMLEVLNSNLAVTHGADIRKDNPCTSEETR